ncbi:class I SAM-dependent methyltransferase [Paenibacillus hamazuiensis]|uniref:class I SAM-dependent methyltransferase n=1 Tax=Paenibacillus hamazuiensis TaxID=2936508 RepID=UPI0020101569|nr:phospholipid methyltransferase [Paenibacillus hamazuiensis]
MVRVIREKLIFLHKFICSPGQIGSVTPSSGFLAKKMMEPVTWGKMEYAAELGAGTGAITRYVNRAKPKKTKVLLFEKDPYLRTRLARDFPDYACYADACELRSALQEEGIDGLDCIWSGLPFFNFPQAVRDRLMEQIAASLKPGGLFIAFQYSLQMKEQLGGVFDIEHIRFVPLNVPPAFVYVCKKKEE